MPHPTRGPLTFAEFARTNRIRCESPDGFNHQLASWSPSDWLVATMGELGEAANLVKKLNRIRDGVPGNNKTETEIRAALRGELADTFIYLDLLAQALGFSLADAVCAAFDRKSAAIGYPGRLRPEGSGQEEA
jgi:NTP pyrophosphatase (non-canonical NTP hydrolase)